MITDDAARQVDISAQPQWQYRIDYFERADEPFYVPERLGDLLIVKVNRAHPFFQALYGDLLRLPGGAKAKEAVDLLLITLARAELLAAAPELEQYAAQRRQRWSPYLATAMRSLSQRLPHEDDAAEDAHC